MTATTEQSANDDTVHVPNHLDYDPTDFMALGDMITTEERGARPMMVIEAQPRMYVHFSLFEDGAFHEYRLTAAEARTLAASLVKAADNLDAGRGTV